MVIPSYQVSPYRWQKFGDLSILGNIIPPQFPKQTVTLE